MADQKPFQSVGGTLGDVSLRGMHRKMVSFFAHAAIHRNPADLINQVFRGSSLANATGLLRVKIKQDVDAEIARLEARSLALDPKRPIAPSGTTPTPKPKPKHKKHKHRQHHPHHTDLPDLIELVVDPTVLLERGILGLELDCSGTQELPAPELCVPASSADPTTATK